MSSNLEPITVGLLWHSLNSDNFGVGALTQSNIRIIDDVAASLGVSVTYYILGSVDVRAPYISGENIHFFGITARSLVKPVNGFYRAVRSCDLIVDIGGGDSFTDIYGSKRMLYLSLSKLIVLLARRPLILAPQTIGPFRAWWSRVAARFLINKSAITLARDSLSYGVLEKIERGESAKMDLATDVAFRLPYEPALRMGKDHIHVGINVSGLMYNGGYTRDNQFGLSVDYQALIRRVVHFFHEENQIIVHLISHVISDAMPVEDDFGVCEALACEFPRAQLAPRFASPSEAKSYISGMDFMLGARMHACIAAASSGVPVVPMAYSRKFGGLFGSLGYDMTVDMTRLSEDEIFIRIIDAYKNREVLAGKVREVSVRAEERLAVYDGILKRLLCEAARGRA